MQFTFLYLNKRPVFSPGCKSRVAHSPAGLFLHHCGGSLDWLKRALTKFCDVSNIS